MAPVGGVQRLETRLASTARWLARHWLALFVAGTGLFVALPVLAPVLAATGHDGASSAIYLAYRVTCHQLPHRSWFIGGRSAAHDWETVRQHLDLPPEAEAKAFHRPIRDPELGYQVAFCQRDTATWLALWGVSVGYALVRGKRRVPALPIKLYLLALVPLGVDGVLQMFGLYESTPLVRTITGAVFGAATALLVLPLLDEGMRDIAAGGAERSRALAPAAE